MSDRMYHNMRCERRIRKNKARRQREMRKNILIIIMTFSLIITASLSMNGFLSKASGKDGTSYKYYKSITIENGDTLWSIAQEYMDAEHYDSINEYINEIRRMNALNNDDITYGRHLIVPYYEDEYVG